MFSNDICDNFLNGFQVPIINQENEIASSEPNETLKEFQSDKVLRPNKKQHGKVRLMWYLFISLISLSLNRT